MDSFKNKVWQFIDLCNLNNVGIDTVEFEDTYNKVFQEDGMEFEFIPHICSLDEDYLAEIYTRGGGEACREANLKMKEIFLREGGGDVIMRDLTTDYAEKRLFIMWETTPEGDRIRWSADL